MELPWQRGGNFSVGCNMFGHIYRFPQGDCCPRARGSSRSCKTPQAVKILRPRCTHHFVPIAVETLGVLGQDARNFFREVGRRVTAVTNEPQSHKPLLQRVAVAIQRGKAAAILGSIGDGS